MFDIAYAATASGTASGAGMGSTIMMIVLMIAIFYFLMIRPENKRKKQAEEMRSALKKGDWLTTIARLSRWISRPPPSSVPPRRTRRLLRRRSRRSPLRPRPSPTRRTPSKFSA